jgi:drug/metabolite transporter (DMT)-like permease
MQIHPDVILGTVLGLLMAHLNAFSVNVYNSQSDRAKPIAIAAVKMWLALGVTCIVVIWQIQNEPFFMPFESILFISLAVAMGPVIGDTIYLAGQERIGVSYAFPITNTYPIITYILSILFLSETLLPFRFIGIIITIIGMSLITREQIHVNEKQNNTFNKIGITLVLVSTILFALSTILLQVGVSDVDAIHANLIRLIVGSILFVPIFIGARVRGMPQPPKHAIKIVLVGAFFGMAIGSLLYVYVVKLVGATFTSVVGSLSPLFALPISIFILKEKVTILAVIGVVLAIIGVILVVLGI